MYRVRCSLLGICSILLLISICCVSPAAADAPRRALVIGNGTYTHPPLWNLTNPVNDAESISRALEKCGFEVATLVNVSKADMKRAVVEFGDRLKSEGGIGLFFYAGHGLQVDGYNYLAPVDAVVERRYDVEDQMMRADYVLAAMEDAGNELNIVILDACRNNPFRSFRGGPNGLAQMDAPQGALLAYATAPGAYADDGRGENGLYSSKILEHIHTPRLPVEAFFKRVRRSVAQASGGRQIPWESTSLTGDFFFTPTGLEAAKNQDKEAVDPTAGPDPLLPLPEVTSVREASAPGIRLEGRWRIFIKKYVDEGGYPNYLLPDESVLVVDQEADRLHISHPWDENGFVGVVDGRQVRATLRGVGVDLEGAVSLDGDAITGRLASPREREYVNQFVMTRLDDKAAE